MQRTKNGQNNLEGDDNDDDYDKEEKIGRWKRELSMTFRRLTPLDIKTHYNDWNNIKCNRVNYGHKCRTRVVVKSSEKLPWL